MTDDNGQPASQDQPPSDRTVGFLVIETIAIAIAIVAPVTPSKTGSTWSPAELFTSDPGYLQKVAASFVLVNLMVLVIGLVSWIALRWSRSD